MTQPDYTAYQLLTNFLPISYQALSHLCLQGHCYNHVQLRALSGYSGRIAAL